MHHQVHIKSMPASIALDSYVHVTYANVPPYPKMTARNPLHDNAIFVLPSGVHIQRTARETGTSSPRYARSHNPGPMHADAGVG